MKTQIRLAIAASLILVSAVAPALAVGGGQGREQGRNRAGSQERQEDPGPDFRGGPPRGARRGSKGELDRLWMGIGRLNESKTPLTKKQAAKILNLVRPGSKKSNLTEANSKTLAQAIKAVLTSAQTAFVSQRSHFGPPGGARDDHRGPRDDDRRGHRPDGPPPGFPDGPPGGPPPDGFGPPPGFGGGPDGPGPDRRSPPSEAERKAIKSFFDSYNPFYAPTGYLQWKKLPAPLQDNLTRRYRRHQSILEAVSRIAKH